MNEINKTRRNIVITIASMVSFSGCTLDREGTAPYYRRDHFYTTDPDEIVRAIQQLGYHMDGVPLAGYIYPEPANFGSIRTVPLYRLYNPGADDHFYTIDEQERNSAMAGGYLNDGIPIAGYVFDVQVPGTVPFYRMWLQSFDVGNDHFYTTSQSERDTAVNQHGYTDEGMEGFIYPSTNTSVPGAVPFYRAYKQEKLN